MKTRNVAIVTLFFLLLLLSVAQMVIMDRSVNRVEELLNRCIEEYESGDSGRAEKTAEECAGVFENERMMLYTFSEKDKMMRIGASIKNVKHMIALADPAAVSYAVDALNDLHYLKMQARFNPLFIF